MIEKYRHSKKQSFKRVLAGRSFAVTGVTAYKPLNISESKNWIFSGNGGSEIVSQLVADGARLQHELAIRGECISDLERKLASRQQRVSDLERELASTQQHNSDLERELASTQQHNSDLDRELA